MHRATPPQHCSSWKTTVFLQSRYHNICCVSKHYGLIEQAPYFLLETTGCFPSPPAASSLPTTTSDAVWRISCNYPTKWHEQHLTTLKQSCPHATCGHVTYVHRLSDPPKKTGKLIQDMIIPIFNFVFLIGQAEVIYDG